MWFPRFTSTLAQKSRGQHEEYPVGRGRLEPVGVRRPGSDGVAEDVGHVFSGPKKDFKLVGGLVAINSIFPYIGNHHPKIIE